MDSAISSLILFTVGIYTALTLSHTYLENQGLLWGAEQSRQVQTMARAQTALTLRNVETQGDGAWVALTVRNSGQTRLADYEKWDLIVEYYSAPEFWEAPQPYDLNIVRLRYTDAPPTWGEWTVSGLFVDAQGLQPEAFDPGIFNPDEEMVIQARLAPSVALTTTNRITLGTPNGVVVSGHFLR
jgi:hypothetical protein